MRLDRNKFLAWLKAKAPNEIVGVARDGCGCPLARFYEETSGGSEIAIFDSGDGHFADRGYSRLRLPVWAGRFVRNIDDEEPDDHQVEAWRALQLLEDA
jgi:hypothetical protein